MADSMSVNSASVTGATDASGNTYTDSISNDSLTTNDFLTLMIEQMKLQDPTKPYDSSQMLETQMQMSTLNSNMQMIQTLQNISTAFQQTAVTNAASLIGKTIEDGSLNSNGTLNSYSVDSIENQDGTLMVKAREMLYAYNGIQLNVDGEITTANYDENGNIFDADGNKTGETLVLDGPGSPAKDENGNLIVKDADGNTMEENNYEMTGNWVMVVSDDTKDIPFSSITRISS